MAKNGYDDISSITLERSSWSINAKVLRVWTSSKFKGAKLPFSMEMVLMDAKGGKIHASVRKTLIYKFHPVMKEGRVYNISHFDAVENGGPYQTTRHGFKINFKFDTDVREVTDVPINIVPFNFVPFSDILFKPLDSEVLVDVIGVLTGVGTVVEWEKDGRMQKRNVIELDSDRLKVECVFFGPYVDELSTYLASDDMTHAVVVIQFAKTRIFQGKPGIQNVYGATKIFFNPEIDQAAEIKHKFLEHNDNESQGLSQLQDPSTISVEDDFLSVTAHKTIEEVKDIKENAVCVVLGTIKVLAPPAEWWYPSCKCSKKVVQDENMFFCENCNRHVFSMTPKYRLAVRVADAKDIATFVIFDQESANLIGKTCAELLDKSKKDSGIPDEISGLIGKTFLFKIEIKNSSTSRFEPSYKVKKVCADEEIINQFKAMFNFSDDRSIYTPSLTTPTSEMRKESTCSNLAKDLIADFVVVDGCEPNEGVPIVDLGRDSQDLTPAKRSSPNEGSADESSNVKLKILANIKKEKI